MGFWTTDWLSCQAAYLETSPQVGRRSAKGWASILITAGWNLLFTMWDHRNHHLHHPQDGLDTTGFQTLRSAAIRELRQGIQDLPAHFQPYFNMTPLQLLLKDLPSLKNWFSTICLAREASNTDSFDLFSANTPLRLKFLQMPPRRSTAPPDAL